MKMTFEKKERVGKLSASIYFVRNSAFGFTDPSTSMTYTVRFNSPLKYKKTAKGLILVDVSVDLVEI